MKTKTTKLINTIYAGLIGAAIIFSNGALAGKQTISQVTVGNGYASGSISSARNSNNSTENIGCSVNYHSWSSSGYWLACTATASNGSSFFCYRSGSDPKFWSFYSQVRNIKEFSNLHMVKDSSLRCTTLNVNNFSQYHNTKFPLVFSR